MSVSETVTPDPGIRPSVDTGWWWQALAQGELLVPTCRACAKNFFPPQAFCPNCGSHDLFGKRTAGLGTIYSWTVTHRAFAPQFSDRTPYAIVAVDLDDGGRLVGRYLDDPAAIHDRMPVRVALFHDGAENLLGFEAAR